MEEKACLDRNSDHPVPKAAKVRRVRVVHISNPTMVKASVSEFRSVVQSLTGQKRSLASATTAQSSPASSSASEGLSEDFDRNPEFKAPKFEPAEGSKCSMNLMVSAGSDVLNICNHNGAELDDRDDAEHRRSEMHNGSPIEIHDILSHQMFESLDGTGDNKFFGLEIFSPSIIFSELDNLYLNLSM